MRRRVSILGFVLAALSPPAGGTQQATGADVTALLDSGRYEQAEVLASTLVATLRGVHGDDAREVHAASDLLVKARLLNGKGASADTLSIAEHTLRRKEALLGSTHSQLVPTLLNLGNALLEAPDYERALTLIRRAVALRERASGPDSIEVADALHELGATLVRVGRYTDALTTLERSLRSKELLRAPRVSIARTLEATGSALQGSGNYEKAAEPIRRAAALQERADANHPAYATTLNLLGLQLWFEGNLVGARDASARAVAVAELALRTGHPTLASALRNLAVALIDLGDLAQARSLFERAVAIVERELGPTHPETGLCVNDLASMNQRLGEYSVARRLFERALKIAEARLGSWHDHVATALYNLALIDAVLGDYGSARRQHARAVAIWERTLGRNHPFVAFALQELATTLRKQGSTREAVRLLDRALAIRERSLGPTHRDVAQTLAELSAALDEAGHAERAHDVASRALRILEAPEWRQSWNAATIFAMYADLQLKRGDALEARKYYDKALTIRREIFGAAHPRSVAAQLGLALSLAHLGHDSDAFATATAAEKAGREHLGITVRHLPERQSLEYSSNRPAGLGLMLSLADIAPRASATVLDTIVRGRGLVFDEMARRRRSALHAGRPELASLWSAVVTAQQRFANLVVRSPSERRPKQYLELVDAARLEKEAAERALAEKSSEFREEIERHAVGLEQIRRAMPPRSAVLSIVRYDRTIPPRAKTVPHYAAFVLLAGRAEPATVQLGTASTIERAVARWRSEAGPTLLTATSTATTETTYRIAGERLRKLVWDPVSGHLADADRVFVVPDGALNLVNLGALPVGASEYLVERRLTIHYLSTERDLIARSESKSAASGLLALGGPSFDATPAIRRGQKSTLRAAPCGTLQTVMFEDLPATLKEATEIAGLWKGAAASGGAEDVHLSIAGQATERAFKQHAPGRRVLHLATHGFFLGAECESARPGTRAVGRVSPARAKLASRVDVQNPLLVSGLAFAGANQRAKAKPDQEDGILTAEEISAMNLQGTEWAVLSACDTGLGEVKAGEGVFGLRRAFQIAGVRTVIMSLWSVEDEATRQWMRALYDARLNERLDTAESVRAASLRVLRHRRAKRLSTHPFYWGAFVSAGDWR